MSAQAIAKGERARRYSRRRLRKSGAELTGTGKAGACAAATDTKAGRCCSGRSAARTAEAGAIVACAVRVTTTVGDDVRQDGRTSLMIFDVPTLVSYVSGVMTLLPGDLILTGTPAGVGPMSVGDRVSVTVEGIGTLTNPVVSHD